MKKHKVYIAGPVSGLPYELLVRVRSAAAPLSQALLLSA